MKEPCLFPFTANTNDAKIKKSFLTLVYQVGGKLLPLHIT